MVEERAHEEEEVRVPLYYERFLEERDKRFSSEIARLETTIRHNGQRIDELRADNARQHEELREAITRLDANIDSTRAELKEEIARLDTKIENVRTELKEEIARLDAKIESYFRWMLGLLLPVILGVVALLIQNLLR